MAMFKICKYCSKRYDYNKQCTCEGSYAAKQRQQRIYDKYIRKSKTNKKYDDFYHSKEWKRFVEYISNKYNNLCVICLIDEGVPVKYDVVHHILEIKSSEGWEHRLNENMCVTLCHDCHNKQHSNYTQDKIDNLIKIVEEYKKMYEV